MKKIVKWLLAIILYYSGLLRLFEYFNGYLRDNWWILEYHRISDAKEDIFKMTVPKKHFERQMRFLKRKYSIISIGEAIERLKAHRGLPRYSLSIIFDDGYSDVYYNALPVLEKYDIKATVFLTSDYVDKDELFWFDEVFELVKASSVRQVSIQFGEGKEFYDLSKNNSRVQFVLRLLGIVKHIKPAERKEYLAQLKSLLEVKSIDCPSKRILSWDETKKLFASGMEIGSHGKSHTILTVLNAYEIDSEVKESKMVIEQHIGVPVTIFSYPNGKEEDFNDLIVSKLYHAGYKGACMNILGGNKGRIDHYRLKRRGIELDSSHLFFGMFSRALFACEVSGIFDLFFFRRERQDLY